MGSGLILRPRPGKAAGCERADQLGGALDARCQDREQTLRRILEDEGLYVRSLPTPLWTEAEMRVLRRDYGKPGPSVSSIAAKLDRLPNEVMLTAPFGFEVAPEISHICALQWPVSGQREAAVIRLSASTAQTTCRSVSWTTVEWMARGSVSHTQD
jgi:hypothetical protein